MKFFDNLKILFGDKKTDLVTNPPTMPTDQQGNVSTNTSNAVQKKVIIVEDEADLANALELKLKRANFAVLKAANGRIGLDMIKTNNPDIVLLDLMMPVMDGKTMLHKLREIPEFKFLPVVVLTNAGDVENIKETKRYDNASAFLIKSNIDPDQVVQVINDLI